MARPRGGDWLLDEIKAIRLADVGILVSLLTPDEVMELDLREEAESCRRQEVIYLSFPIPDRKTPPFSERTFTFLEQLHRQFQQESMSLCIAVKDGAELLSWQPVCWSSLVFP